MERRRPEIKIAGRGLPTTAVRMRDHGIGFLRVISLSDFAQLEEGAVAAYTLRNISDPEFRGEGRQPPADTPFASELR